jgi:hypothetical protein
MPIDSSNEGAAKSRLVRASQLSKALAPILLTDAGMVIDVNKRQLRKVISLIASSDEGAAKVRVASFIHCEKALTPMVATDAGIATGFELTKKHPVKAAEPIASSD